MIYPFYLFPLVTLTLLLCLWVCFCFVSALVSFFLDPTHAWDPVVFTSPSVITSGSMQTALLHSF